MPKLRRGEGAKGEAASIKRHNGSGKGEGRKKFAGAPSPLCKRHTRVRALESQGDRAGSLAQLAGRAGSAPRLRLVAVAVHRGAGPRLSPRYHDGPLDGGLPFCIASYPEQGAGGREPDITFRNVSPPITFRNVPWTFRLLGTATVKHHIS